MKTKNILCAILLLLFIGTAQAEKPKLFGKFFDSTPKINFTEKKSPIASLREKLKSNRSDGERKKLALDLRLSSRKYSELTVRTTAYTHNESDHVAYGKKTCVGTTLKYGDIVSVAADWSFMPFGTKFKIEGDNRTYLVEDIGSALTGTRTLDIYKPSISAMDRWGVRNVKIRIIEKGSRDKSRELLAKRLKYWHCRKMYNNLA